MINYNYHRFKFLNEDFRIAIDNYPIIYDGKTSSDNFKKSIFSYYVDDGIYKGTPRDYVEEYKGLKNDEKTIKDIKTGKYYDDIIKTEYTIDELNDLLKSIEQNNMKFLNNIENDENNKFDDEFIDNLKKESINGLGVQLNILIQNLVNILGKTKKNMRVNYIIY